MYDLILRDATILSSRGRQVADVAIEGGRIAYVGPRPPRSTHMEISAIGKFLMPGVIDTAVQFDANGDPGLWERESRAAVTGGVTTIIALPGGQNPVVCPESAKRRAERAAGRSWCNYGLWGCAERGRIDDLAEALHQKRIVGTLAAIRDEHPPSSERLIELLALRGVFGVRLTYQDRTGPGIGLLVDAARERDKHVHLVHLSTAEELQVLDPVRGHAPVTAGVTPHHLFLSADTVQPVIRTVPPVRPEMDRRTLWTAMKRGRLDCVASDHHPTPLDKEDGGVPGAELLFPLMLSAVKYGRLSLEMLVSLCSEAPARIFGLERKGHISRGADADLILFSEGELTKVDDQLLLSSAGWSPYLERETAPKPDLVIVGGRITARSGQLVGEAPGGTHVLDN